MVLQKSRQDGKEEAGSTITTGNPSEITWQQSSASFDIGGGPPVTTFQPRASCRLAIGQERNGLR